MFVKDAMTTNLITVDPKTTLPDIEDLFREHDIRRVPVLERGKLVGIISDHDVMASMPSPATSLSRWEVNTLLDKLTAREIMTSPVLSTTPDCPLEETAQILLEKKFGAMPVLEDGELVGIITESDLFRMFVRMLSGGDEPGLRFVLRVERHRGVLAQVAGIVRNNGGAIVAMATINEEDGAHKRVLVKEEGADADKVRAALEEVDVEVLDVRDRGGCAGDLAA